MSNFLEDLPRLFPRPEQTIAGIGRLLRQGEVTCVDILSACLQQCDEWEPKVCAWVVLDRKGALKQARALDNELRTGRDRGPLHGIPIGIKDIIDVRGLPTACGAKRWADRIAEDDAELVERLREAGAVIMGKTVTTPYAWIDPPPTRNPWNLDRTPGGSSSGSAAAVACGMCYGAIGTQTGGSITRPASFCGVAGMKPTRVRISVRGVYPFAASLDHVGPIARGVEDLRILFRILQQFGVNHPGFDQAASVLGKSRPRLARLRGFFDHRSEPAVRSAFDEAIRSLLDQKAMVVEIDDPLDFEEVLRDHRVVMAAEAASVHTESLDSYPDDYPPRIRELIIEGRSISAPSYIRSRDRMSSACLRFWDAMTEYRLVCAITPAAVSTAPDPSTTGDPAFNSPWSYTGLPTVSFPAALASDGMPVALQFVNALFTEHILLDAARWCEHAIQARQP
jgi:aspartyl-tRNA(Asn)/glutamyl-tRNA(Gln) amidotransferase subunit A